jgi:arabinose-5-phosphate isomerase
MTGNPASTLAREADIPLDVSVLQEACPLNLAPTARTTASLALGDALAVALLDARGFRAEDFALSHPGGSLGRRLLTRVEDVMRKAGEVPVVCPQTALAEAILTISRGGLGMTAITDNENKILGIFTDGDLRRALENRKSHASEDFLAIPTERLMRPDPYRIAPNRLAVEAVEIMERQRINQLLVADESGHLIGALNMHDLFAARVI